MMPQTWIATALLSALGSLHCAGMCGPLTTLYIAPGRADQSRRFAAHAAYSVGRWISYCAVGSAAYLLGTSITKTGQLLQIQQAALWISASILVIWGVVTVAYFFRASITRQTDVIKPPALTTPRLTRLITRMTDVIYALPQSVRAPLFGLTTGFIPCGWLYAYVLYASAATTWTGALGTMTAFWIGTLPAMLGAAVLLQQLSCRIRRYVPVVTAVAMVTVGVVSITSRVATSAQSTVAKPAHCCH